MANATRRIVLERRMVVDATVLTQVGQSQPVAIQHPTDAPPFEAWVEVAHKDGATSDEAVDAYAGKSFTPGCKPGQRRAVSIQAWGNVRTTENFRVEDKPV